MKEQHLSRGELSFMKLNFERIPLGAKPTSTNIYCIERDAEKTHLLKRRAASQQEIHAYAFI